MNLWHKAKVVLNWRGVPASKAKSPTVPASVMPSPAGLIGIAPTTHVIGKITK